MPFKGDRRLGGPHRNEATLNGTSSDFDSVLAAGTVISGPTDTSRYENDYNGTPFYMPYSTTVYADGLGGQNSIETWGLQYLPAGWVTGSGAGPISVDGRFTSNGGYAIGDWYTVGSYSSQDIEDGTGINYQSSSNNFSAVDDQVLAESIDHDDGVGGLVYRWRIKYDADTNTAYKSDDNTQYPSYGQYLNNGGGPLTSNWGYSGTQFTWGSFGFSTYTNGTGGEFQINSSNDELAVGTYLGESQGDYFYYDGNGTTRTGYAPAGMQISSSGSSSFNWTSPDGSQSGTFTYSNWGCSGYADGMGGINQQMCGGWSASSGELFAYGNYYWNEPTGMYDENGNEIYNSRYTTWNYTYDGNGGYNTNTSTS